MRRTAIGNNKGGVGKTAGTVNLAAALARAGRRVLVVDMDPQGNTTRRLAVTLTPEDPTISEAIASAACGCAADAITPCGWETSYADRIDVIPAAADLVNRGSELHLLGAVRRLAKAMDGADGAYDVTLIDCGPSLGHLTQLALAAATDVLVVIEPEYDAIESALRFRAFIGEARDDLGVPDLAVTGYLVSRVREQLAAHRYQMAGLAGTFGGELVWAPHIPERAVIKDANEAAVPVETVSAVGRAVAAMFDELAAQYLAAAVAV